MAMHRTMFMLTLLAFTGCDTPVATKPPAPTTPPVVAPPPIVQPPPMTERVVADTGVGEKGCDYGGGIFTEPVRQYFRAPQMVVFDIEIPKAMSLFKATNDNKGPASHDEFMKRIIEE